MSENQYIKKSKISNLHQNESLNSIQVKIGDDYSRLLFTCSDTELKLYNESNKTKTFLFNDEDAELNQLVLLETNLYVANSECLQIFDINTLKQLSNYKISRDTINTIEINQNKGLIACSDDLGEIKLLDLRVQNLFSNKKVLKKHDNICSSVKFNPFNDQELFSGSFDSTIAKWDLRTMNSINKISVSDVLTQKEPQNDENSLVSNMTPCFVHSLNMTSLNQEPILLSGIENGFCLAFNAKTCECLTLKQVKNFNCALTSIVKIEESCLNNKFQNYLSLVNANELFISCGNDLSIEFFYLNNKNRDIKSISIEKLNKFTLNHGNKINNATFSGNNLFTCDTSADLTIYNLDILCN